MMPFVLPVQHGATRFQTNPLRGILPTPRPPPLIEHIMRRMMANLALEAQATGTTDKPTSSSVFSMFGGGAKKEKKDEEEGRGDVSGSAKAQREAAAAAKEGEEVSICFSRWFAHSAGCA